jgi:hypothetical protein
MADQLKTRRAAAAAAAPRRRLPGKPQHLVVTSVSSHAVTLRWKPAKHGVKAAGYEVLRDGKQIGTTRHHLYADHHVTAGRVYQYSVRAYDAGHQAGHATKAIRVHVPKAVVPPDTQPPSVPGGVSAQAQSDTQIALSWSRSHDNVAVAAYDVYRDGTFVTSVTNPSLGDTGLAAGTDYG